MIVDFNFFLFFENISKIENVEKHQIFTSGQLKYKKFTHLDEKCADV